MSEKSRPDVVIGVYPDGRVARFVLLEDESQLVFGSGGERFGTRLEKLTRSGRSVMLPDPEGADES